MTEFHLAQVNIATFKLPQEHAQNKPFVDALDEVNAIAEAQPGFVWRLVGDGNDALDVQPFENPLVAINLSVWTDLEALAAFVYRQPAHTAIMRRRREWFARMDVYQALWWVQAGDQPTVEEAQHRLAWLQEHGPSATAFTFKQPFPQTEGVNIQPVLDDCA